MSTGAEPIVVDIPNRSAASGTTTDSLSDGVSLDGTHQQRLRLPADPPPVTRRPA